MIDRVVRTLLLGLALFGLAANAVGFVYLTYNPIRLFAG